MGFARASVFGELPVLIVGIVIAALAAVAVGVRRLARAAAPARAPHTRPAARGARRAGAEPGGRARRRGRRGARVRPRRHRDGGQQHRGSRCSERRRPRRPQACATSTFPLPVLRVRSCRRALRAPSPCSLGDRVVFIDTHPVSRAHRDLGLIAIIRDRTDIVGLTERLETVAAMTNALRVQRHEFANRLHVTAGLIDAGRVADARTYLDEHPRASRTTARRRRCTDLGEPFLESFLEAKAIHAAERGVLAARRRGLARARGGRPAGGRRHGAGRTSSTTPSPRRCAETNRGGSMSSCSTTADTLVVTVADSGPGVAGSGAPVRRPAASGPDPDAVHGHGIGLPLAREIAARLGGRCLARRRGRARRHTVRSSAHGCRGSCVRHPSARLERRDTVMTESIRVLVVDDDFHVGGLHRDIVAARPGFAALEPVRGVRSARAAVRDRHPDLVICDVYLPDGDGIAVRRRDRRRRDRDQRRLGGRHRAPCAAGRCAGTTWSSPSMPAVLAERLDAYRRFLQPAAGGAPPRSGGDRARAAGAVRPGRRCRADLAVHHRAPDPRSARRRGVLRRGHRARAGISRATAQRHLAALATRGAVEVTLKLRIDRATRAPLQRRRLTARAGHWLGCTQCGSLRSVTRNVGA